MSAPRAFDAFEVIAAIPADAVSSRGDDAGDLYFSTDAEDLEEWAGLVSWAIRGRRAGEDPQLISLCDTHPEALELAISLAIPGNVPVDDLSPLSSRSNHRE